MLRNLLEHAGAREAFFATQPNVSFALLERAELPAEATESFDFVYSLDVFAHLDVHTMLKYFREFRQVLKPGGDVVVQTTNLRTPDGWERFSQPKRFIVVGHYFVTPDLAALPAEHAGLTPVKTFYFSRDHLVALRKG